jgi:hypothetical protein
VSAIADEGMDTIDNGTAIKRARRERESESVDISCSSCPRL